MARPRTPVLAAIGWLIILVIAAQAALLLALTWGRDLHDDLFGAAGGAAFIVLALACATTGAAIIIRVGGNAVGPAFLAIGAFAASAMLGYQYAAYAVVHGAGTTGGVAAAYTSGLLSELVAPLLGVALLTFPDGRLPSRRWWPALGLAAGSGVCLVVSAAFAPGRFDAPFDTFANPLGVAGTKTLANATDAIGWALAVAAIGAGVVALVRRRGEARADQRRQLRFVLRVGIPAGVIVTADMVLWIAWNGLPQQAAMAAIGLAFAAFAAAVGVAVVRLRLFEERRRIDGFVADVLAGRANPEAVEPLLAQTLGDPSLSIAYALLGDDGLVDREGRPCAGSGAPGRIGHEVVHADERIAVISCAPGTSHDTLGALTAQAATAINVARLRIGLRRQLNDLAVARSRIVSAGEAERRRLQRDLHDGAQARLISVGLALRNLRRDAIDDASAGRRLDDAVDELAGAITELRELSTGSSPSLLDAGLQPALAALAETVPVPVRVEIPDERFSPGVESAAYFVACEGLANAIKHARARNVVLSAERTADQLVVRVADDGIGGADAGAGRGLAGLRDRVAGLGGLLEVDSGPAAGTTLTAWLPCAS